MCKTPLLEYPKFHAKLFLQIQFFAHLTMAKLVSPESMIDLLQSFTAVLDEFGVSHGRAKRAAICAAEGLMIVCYIISWVILEFRGKHREAPF
jgi:hypothetical protein